MTVRRAAVAASFLALLLESGCATARPGRALDLLTSRGKVLGWGGIYLTQTRAEIEQVLGRKLRVQDDHYSDACGSAYTDVHHRGHRISLQWADATETADLEVITVSLTTAERAASPQQLNRWALDAVPALTAEAPTYLTLGETVLNIQEDAPEPLFFVSVEACVD